MLGLLLIESSFPSCDLFVPYFDIQTSIHYKSLVAANILELLLWSLCLEANAIELLLFVENCGPQPNIMILISIHWAQPWS